MKKTKEKDKEINQEITEVPLEVILGLILKSINELNSDIKELKKAIVEKPKMI